MYNSNLYRSRSSKRNILLEKDKNYNTSEHHSNKSNHLINILTNSFKPIINSAYKMYMKDNYSETINKIQNDRSLLMGKKSEMDLIHENYFRKSFWTYNQSPRKSPKKSPRKSPRKSPKKCLINETEPILIKKNSYLIENNIINKQDIIKNPCNKNVPINNTTDESSHEDYFYKQEKMWKELYDEKKNEMKTNVDKNILKELKPTPGIDEGSKKIIINNKLDQRLPIYLRYKELTEEKFYKRQSLSKSIEKQHDKDYNSVNFKAFKSYNNKALNLDSINTTIANDLNTSNNNEFRLSISLPRCKSFNSKNTAKWINEKNNWLKHKNGKIEERKNIFEKLAKERQERALTFTPVIDNKSKHIANLKNQHENPGLNVYKKLYSMQNKKKEKIQSLQEKYKPTFKPKVNKFPNYFSNKTVSQMTKSFYIEEKEDDYANFIANIKNKSKNEGASTRTGSKSEKLLKIVNSNDFIKKKNNDEGIISNPKKKNYKKSKKEVEEFFFSLNQGKTTNNRLEIEEIKFYNDIQKN